MENLSKILETKPKSRREHAFQTILRNRTAHGGILANGAGLIKNGENGKGIKSRWYPQTIARRINMMSSIIEKVEFIGGDAFDVLTKYKRDAQAFFFIDPPYTAGGKKAGARLYRHSEIDHKELFFVCSKLAGHFLMTYDYAEEVCLLAKKYCFETKPIAMKNTHHAPLTELLISRDLNWLN